jgi:Ca2+-binding RTX toxin-like protein
MLEANSNLGYRDVQEIIAYSSIQNDPLDTSWIFNGAGNWNGGGLHFSHDYGFGLIDAHKAVRLAESWDLQQTYANNVSVTADYASSQGLTDLGTIITTLDVVTDIEIEHVLLHVDITHTKIGDLSIVLISPDGSESHIMTTPEKGDYIGSGTLDFVFSSTVHWGETSAGTWTLRIEDHVLGNTGTLNSWDLEFLGNNLNTDDLYIFTDEFANFSGAELTSRSTINENNGGSDVLNLSTLVSASTIDLENGTGTIVGQSITINTGAGDSIEKVIGGDGNDIFTGDNYDNNLFGGRGDDVLEGGAGNDTLDGGAGNDIAVFSSFVDDFTFNFINPIELIITHLSSTLGTDTLLNIESFQFTDGTYTRQELEDYINQPIINGTGDNDVLSGTAFGNQIYGDLGNDTIYGEDGNDRIYGEGGNDIIYGGENQDLISGGVGDDTIHGGLRADQLRGGSGADTIYGDEDNDRLMGEDGNDIMHGGAGGDALYGGLGDDELNGDGGFDYILGGDGADTLNGGAGGDRLYGENDNDTINGDGENDLIDGGAGNDILSGGTGHDTIYGGLGDDELNGDDGFDTLRGGDGADTLNGGLGNDRLYGENDNDTINGGAGQDLIEGGAGIDILNGGDGYDTLNGGAGADTLNGDNQNDTLSGGDGADILNGGYGADRLYGDGDNDYLYGNWGSDILDGGLGDDFLYGYSGPDTLTGGGGADTFVFEAGQLNHIDVVTDFSTVENDVIDVSDILSYDPLSDNITDFVRITDNGIDSTLEVDFNGGADSFVTVATLQGVIGLTDEAALETSGHLIA